MKRRPAACDGVINLDRTGVIRVIQENARPVGTADGIQFHAAAVELGFEIEQAHRVEAVGLDNERKCCFRGGASVVGDPQHEIGVSGGGTGGELEAVVAVNAEAVSARRQLHIHQRRHGDVIGAAGGNFRKWIRWRKDSVEKRINGIIHGVGFGVVPAVEGLVGVRQAGDGIGECAGQLGFGPGHAGQEIHVGGTVIRLGDPQRETPAGR